MRRICILLLVLFALTACAPPWDKCQTAITARNEARQGLEEAERIFRMYGRQRVDGEGERALFFAQRQYREATEDFRVLCGK